MVRIIRAEITDLNPITMLITELLTELDGKKIRPTLSNTILQQWIKDDHYVVFLALNNKNQEPLRIITLTETRSLYAQGCSVSSRNSTSDPMPTPTPLEQSCSTPR